MILTGSMIEEAVSHGDIVLAPFSSRQLNPNSYNYRLGNWLKKSVAHDDGSVTFESVEITSDGCLLAPQTLYLGYTAERIGSPRYAMSLIGRSSMGRLGLFLQVSANLGHRGSAHHWTLEIFSCQPLRVFPLMTIGQVSFWKTTGRFKNFSGRYAQENVPFESLGIPMTSPASAR